MSVASQLLTVAFWYAGRPNTSENPPPPSDHPSSVEVPVVPPTVVTQGQPAGNEVVKKGVPFALQSDPTPESPDATRTETPRAPSSGEEVAYVGSIVEWYRRFIVAIGN